MSARFRVSRWVGSRNNTRSSLENFGKYRFGSESCNLWIDSVESRARRIFELIDLVESRKILPIVRFHRNRYGSVSRGVESSRKRGKTTFLYLETRETLRWEGSIRIRS